MSAPDLKQLQQQQHSIPNQTGQDCATPARLPTQEDIILTAPIAASDNVSAVGLQEDGADNPVITPIAGRSGAKWLGETDDLSLIHI